MISSEKEYGSMQKILMILSVLLIHSMVWAFVNYYNSSRPPVQLNNLSIFIDLLIPYLGWSWFIYYFGHIYIVAGSSLVIWNYRRKNFNRTILLFALMIVVGGIIQLMIPAKSPLPLEMGYIHKWIHNNFFHDPYVCFPSMHVALAALPTFLLLDKYKTIAVRIIIISFLLLICISTVTLKEHFIVDIVAGMLLASFFYLLFRLKTFNYKKDIVNG